MSTEAVPVASSRGLKRITCVNSTAVPVSVATLDTSVAGVYKVMDAVDPLSSGASGTQRRVKVLPCSTTSAASFVLVVYGSFYVIDQWLWIPLFKGTIAATLAQTGVSSASSIATTEFLPVTITQAANGPSVQASDITNYGAGDGPAHAVVDTRGCPFLLFQASTTGKFVLVGGHS